MLRPANVLALALLSLAAANCLSARPASEWERENRRGSPAENAKKLAINFNGHSGSPDEDAELSAADLADLFDCKPASSYLFNDFARNFNRTFHGDPQEQLDRRDLFASTIKRTILLNRVIQNEAFNLTNYAEKREIRNYHFVSPVGETLWYSDITDCELGMIKYIVFNIIYRIDRNELEHAYQIALGSSEFLPILGDDGFEQLANILLVRLFDRFKGDEKMNQLFQWPLYLKKLAGYAYNRRLLNDSKFVDRLPLLTFAYPSFFKDVRFNAQAVDRSRDNSRANNEHKTFSAIFGHNYTDIKQQNRRLAIFRQRQTLLDLLNDRFRSPIKVSIDQEIVDRIAFGGQQNNLERGRLVRLRKFGYADKPLNLTQFSDLTDAEFVAFLTNDFSLLESNQQSAEFIDANFPIRPLDDEFRDELAAELELRRVFPLKLEHPVSEEADKLGKLRDSFVMARKVVDELIEDVGLPIGQVTTTDGESEAFRTFNNVAAFFNKPYMTANLANPSEADWADERQRRFEQFKVNLGRTNAWLLKDGRAKSNEERLQWALMRLADLSWTEIKLTLFKICCLTEENLRQLGDRNSTIAYLGTNQFLCGKMSADEQPGASGDTDSSEDARKRERAALELYYYYTMHFNKHPTDPAKFSKKFSIFRRNIDHIRRHSCNRGLTLYHSLRLKRADTLSSIDTLDPRRSYTDDINLDRYLYFSLPKLVPGQTEDSSEPKRFETSGRQRVREDVNTRAGFSYYLDEIGKDVDSFQRYPGGSFYLADQLVSENNDVKSHVSKYDAHRAWRIYDLVEQRYRLCRSSVSAPAVQLRHRCKPVGPTVDHGMAGTSYSPADQHYGHLQEDSCAFYWMGLEPWAEGLTGQDRRSVELIRGASCRL